MRRSSQVFAVLGVALVLAACSSSSKSSSSSSTAASETTTTAAETPTTATGATTTTAAPTPADLALQAKLLAPSDVGSAFAAGTYQPSDPTQPEPCGTKSADLVYPASAMAGAEFDDATDEAAIVETIDTYADAATAQQAFTLDLQGVTCAQGNQGTGSNAVTINFQAPTDVASQVSADKASDIQYTSPQGFHGDLLGMLSGSTIVALQVQIGGTTTPAGFPDTVTVSKAALAKANGS